MLSRENLHLLYFYDSKPILAPRNIITEPARPSRLRFTDGASSQRFTLITTATSASCQRLASRKCIAARNIDFMITGSVG